MRAHFMRIAEHAAQLLDWAFHDIFTKRSFSTSFAARNESFSFEQIRANEFYEFKYKSRIIELLCFVTDHNSSHKCQSRALCRSQSLRVARINSAAARGLLLSSDP
jgi:hypothetical protein